MIQGDAGTFLPFLPFTISLTIFDREWKKNVVSEVRTSLEI